MSLSCSAHRVSAETVSRQLSAEFIFSAAWEGGLKWLLELTAACGVSGQWLLKSPNAVV